MNAYKYDENGLYIGVVDCQIDPLETRKKGETVYLLPRNATYTKPPKAKEGFNIVWNGSAWEYAEIPAPPEPEPPHEPTKEEKLSQLVAQYESDKAEFLKYYADAMIHGDSDLMAELKEEMTELDEQYATDYEALKGED